MRIILIILTLLMPSLQNQGYKKLKFYSDLERLKQIEPDYQVDYWDYRRYDGIDGTTEIIYKRGKSTKKAPIVNIESTCIVSGHPLICYDYITYVYKDKVHIITEKEDFLKFIGKINNVYEGLFSLNIQFPDLFYYSTNDNNLESGSYLLTKDSISFILLKDENEILDEANKLQMEVGQYKVIINRYNHESHVTRIKDYKYSK